MKVLVCGTRRKGYESIVHAELEFEYNGAWDVIIEGCCPDSADEYAEEWAKQKEIEIEHHPSTSGNYLKRNIEMVSKADKIIAFWDGYSYGTAHAIAHGMLAGKKVIVVDLSRERGKVKEK